VMARSGLRAYVNNELNTSMSALNLADNTVITRDIESSAPPAPGTQAHRNLVGKLAFFTALGIPDKLDNTGDGQFDVALRDINPLANRGKASNNAWSGCASCHDDGHSDNVTWIFETGPRQTIPLEGTFARNNLGDQRILNWSAVRGSNTDFNNNSRGIQGGTGFATNVDGVDKSAQVFNHGPTRGISDSLDAMSEWVATVRAPIMPAVAANTEANGRAVFTTVVAVRRVTCRRYRSAAVASRGRQMWNSASVGKCSRQEGARGGEARAHSRRGAARAVRSVQQRRRRCRDGGRAR